MRATLVVAVPRRPVAVALLAITVFRGARCPVTLLRETFTGPAVVAVAHRVGVTFRAIRHLFAVIVTIVVCNTVSAAYKRICTSRRATTCSVFAVGVHGATLAVVQLFETRTLLETAIVAFAIATVTLIVRPTLFAIGKGGAVVARSVHG